MYLFFPTALQQASRVTLLYFILFFYYFPHFIPISLSVNISFIHSTCPYGLIWLQPHLSRQFVFLTVSLSFLFPSITPIPSQSNLSQFFRYTRHSLFYINSQPCLTRVYRKSVLEFSFLIHSFLFYLLVYSTFHTATFLPSSVHFVHPRIILPNSSSTTTLISHTTDLLTD